MNQNTALKALKNGYNVFLTGPAGSGKTFVLNKFIVWLRKNDRTAAITASTGIAATHLNGITIHSWSGLGIKDSLSGKDLKKIARNRKAFARLVKTEVLVIDEVSMLHAYQLDLIDRICQHVRASDQPFGGLQVVLSGDFFQLPPVSRSNNQAKFIFESAGWKAMNIRICYLDEQHRQADSGLIDLLNGIRANQVASASLVLLQSRLNAPLADNFRPTRLYTHNVDVDRENSVQLALIKARPFSYTMQTQGNKKLVEALMAGCLAPENLILKIGSQVMFVKNNFEAGYVNGTIGIVIEFDKESRMPVVKTSGGKRIVARPETWEVEEGDEVLAAIRQLPLRLAWAITVHKSQGMSLDAAEMDLAKSFEFGMGYVALSRVRSLAGLRLMGFNDMALQINPKILEFDCRLKEQSDQFERELAGRYNKIIKHKILIN
jgi:ATP-dependent exoDNAse (exonuclease V) alpha subunit